MNNKEYPPEVVLLIQSIIELRDSKDRDVAKAARNLLSDWDKNRG